MTLALPGAPKAVRNWTGPALMLAGGVAIGFAPIGLRLGLDTLGPQAIAFWRYAFAAPMILLVLVMVNRRAPVRPNGFVILAGTFFALDIALWHWSLTLTTVANATFIVNLGNVGVGFAAWLFLRERPNGIWFLAIAVALSGAVLLTFGGGTGGQSDLRGDALALGAALLVSGYMLAAKLARRSIGALDVLFWLTVTEACIGGLVVMVSGERLFPADPAGWRSPLVLAVLVQFLGQGLIIAGLGRTPAGMAGVLVLIQPVTAATVSWQLFDEPLVALQIAGAGFVLAGVFLSQAGRTSNKLS